MRGLTLALTTAASSATARAIGRRLVDERLAACATILPGARSIYRWKGRVDEAVETVLLLKTTAAQLPALRRRLRALHSYELPEDIAVSVTAGPAYGQWIRDGTLSPAARPTRPR